MAQQQTHEFGPGIARGTQNRDFRFVRHCSIPSASHLRHENSRRFKRTQKRSLERLVAEG
jgi:hypothetical protein